MFDPNDFYKSFKAETRDIQHGLLAKEVSVAQALQRHGQLARTCRDNLRNLPLRDQDTYNSDLKELLTLIRGEASEARPKFVFSHRQLAERDQLGEGDRGDEGVGQDKEVTHGSRPSDNDQSADDVEMTDDTIDTPRYADHDAITNTDHEMLSSPQVSHQSSTKIKLDGIRSSVINLTKPYSTAEIDNVHNSLILLYRINGPIYINNVTNSVLVVACHQFRMHKSSNVQVFVSSKRPIVEDCSHVTFGDFPDLPQFPNLVTWEAIDDFSDLTGENSASWVRADNSDVKLQIEKGLDLEVLKALPGM